MLVIVIWEDEYSGLIYKKGLLPSIILPYYKFIQQINTRGNL